MIRYGTVLAAIFTVLDPHHIDVDPDSNYHPDADPDADMDSDFSLMRILMRNQIRLLTLMRIWIQILASK